MGEQKLQAEWQVVVGGDFTDTTGFDTEGGARECAEHFAPHYPNHAVHVYELKAYVVATQPAPKLEWCNKVGEC